MEKLSTYRNTKDVVDKYKFKFSKSLGQNFLINSNIIDEIINGARITEDDYVVEIGPGIGTLTKEMANIAKKVVAVEIDKKLIPILKDTLSECDNVEVVNQDILKVDIKELVNEKLDGRPIKLVANLPYYITTPIVMKFLEEDIVVSDIVVMVQKEVADRMSADPCTKAYGSLSVAVQYYSEPHIIAKVPKSMFIPQPNVDSTVIALRAHEEIKHDLKDKELFFKVVKAAFSKRRKTILNAISSYDIELSKEEVNQVLEDASIDAKRRGETLSIDEFANLANKVYDKLENK
ncbi:16S rRNA (adenine(1518)-N(6)/adenine(1519)-N(6))-dimethyltransferase RsmA [Tepidibacter hydrothermalis]|uniref:Ribosomal RNA small subunit methyltransferase A n=1 Tax=Tepidibacter hydrothermalis TaxID=3036126 RepID=A0ABY8EBZ9_9FIRM|nr:16S rRNA (adenine(1518)-N(6)/adenine(1519)-N(6))-dimethyltransferase RsmA [Tepidibacter hydrothermalis]WFD10477.1 16S rRNA (adenine(1518)-N(6)/adenine(1519)-N(6))-dimethyltransferase RsmA [Tepidibacter hydrothermalis]